MSRRQPKSGTCTFCGCTDDHACEGGCTWVDNDHTICSECIPEATLDALKKLWAVRPVNWSDVKHGADTKLTVAYRAAQKMLRINGVRV